MSGTTSRSRSTTGADGLEASNVDPTLWFAVKDGDEIAATAVCDRERFGMGWVDAIGVRKRWRRRSLELRFSATVSWSSTVAGSA